MSDKAIEMKGPPWPPAAAARDFAYTSEREPHFQRARALLAAHPEIRDLTGPRRVSAVGVFVLVTTQVALAWALRDSPAWLVVAAAWLVGAFLTHALWALIHECTHNLVFRNPNHNHALQLFANLPMLVPAASTFRRFHLLHHRHQGDIEYDVDLPSRWEARLVGHGFVGKSLWLLNIWIFQPLRVPRLKRVPFVDRWYLVNVATEAAFIAAVWILLGPWALLYLFLATIFGIGMHPLGARWIQEHHLVRPDQETYSYYGPLNRLSFNIGYHNEHHDATGVPWMHLPAVRRLAPEFYDSLYAHRSWTRLWLRFLVDPSLSPFSRMARDESALCQGPITEDGLGRRSTSK